MKAFRTLIIAAASAILFGWAGEAEARDNGNYIQWMPGFSTTERTGTCRIFYNYSLVLTIPFANDQFECQGRAIGIWDELLRREVQAQVQAQRRQQAQSNQLIQNGVNNKLYHQRCDAMPANSCAALTARRNAGCKVFALEYRAYCN